jgi:uncharacterized protein
MQTSLEDYVRETLKNDRSGHGYSHAERVRKTALALQKEEGGDPRIIEAAALVHDTIDSKLFSDQAHQVSLLQDELVSLGYSPKEIEAILAIITHMSWHLHDETEKTKEAKIVIDADRLEALGAIGLVRTIEYGASKGRAFYEENNLAYQNGKASFKESTETTLSHLYDKLLKLEGTFYTATAEKEAKRRSDFLRAFLDEFYHELSV